MPPHHFGHVRPSRGEAAQGPGARHPWRPGYAAAQPRPLGLVWFGFWEPLRWFTGLFVCADGGAGLVKRIEGKAHISSSPEGISYRFSREWEGERHIDRLPPHTPRPGGSGPAAQARALAQNQMRDPSVRRPTPYPRSQTGFSRLGSFYGVVSSSNRLIFFQLSRRKKKRILSFNISSRSPRIQSEWTNVTHVLIPLNQSLRPGVGITGLATSGQE